MIKIKESLFKFKNKLVTIGQEEPLNKLSLVVIIALDLFILFVVFEGLDDHTKQITSPSEYVPYECQEFFIKRSWSDANFLTNLQRQVLSEHNNYSYRYESLLKRSNVEAMHNSCEAFYTKIKLIADNKELKGKFVERQESLKDKKQFTVNFKKSKDVYDTSLLENIAERNNQNDKLPAIKTTLNFQKTEIEKITQRILNIEKQINSHNLIIDLKELLKPNTQYRQRIVTEFKEFQAIYPLKELGWQMVFMLPLFCVFYIWSSISSKKDYKAQTLVASHLLVVVSIPIILKIADVVLDLIPRHFLKNFFRVLESLHIIAVWHYIVILFSVCVGLFSIYIIQKKIFNKQRVQQKRLMKGACYGCGRKLPYNTHTCPFCGKKQFKNCSQCQEETFICGSYCKNCGHKLLEDKHF